MERRQMDVCICPRGVSSFKHQIKAVIYDKRGRVLSIGANSYVKTHTVQSRYAHEAGCPERIFLHAEISAIIRCKSIEKAYRIFVSRFDKNGNPRNAKPCKVCTLAIQKSGIEVIEYTVNED